MTLFIVKSNRARVRGAIGVFCHVEVAYVARDFGEALVAFREEYETAGWTIGSRSFTPGHRGTRR